MSDSDPRTGMFHQTLVTAGDTACNVNEVLQVFPLYFFLNVMSHMNFPGSF